MAIVIVQPNILILEPVKCGTTWMRDVLTESGVEWNIADPVQGVCPRHSYREHYKGEFSRVYCPIRSPYSWLVSYYNFHRGLKRLPFLDNRFYGHRPFGISMPLIFSDFVDYVVTTEATVSDYFLPFIQGSTDLIRQEALRTDLSLVLESNGVKFDQSVINGFPRVNESNKLGGWSQVPGELYSRFKKQEGELLNYCKDASSGHTNA